MKRLSLLLAVAGFAGRAAAIAITDTNAVTQSFDAMGSTLILPADWRVASGASPAWSGASTVVTARCEPPKTRLRLRVQTTW